MKYPKIKEGWNIAPVIITFANGRKIKAMFYWNGKEPRFASFGVNVTSQVIDWQYR